MLEAHGFFHSYAGGFDPAKLTDGLAAGVKVVETGVKPYACCRYSQTPLDGILELRATHGLRPEAIDRIRITIPSTGLPLVATPADRKRRPADSVEAQFSLPYSSAVALVTGAAGREEFRSPWLTDPRVLDLAQRVEVDSDPEIDRLFPAKWPARVSVLTRDGEDLQYYGEDCLGDPAKPLTRGQLIEKFKSLTSGTLSPECQDSIPALVHDIENEGRASTLTRRIVDGFQ